VSGGEWRKSRFSRWGTYFLRYFQIAKSFIINTFRPAPFGKNTNIFAGFYIATNTQKVAVGGGGWRKSRFSRSFQYVKNCGIICGISTCILFPRTTTYSPYDVFCRDEISFVLVDKYAKLNLSSVPFLVIILDTKCDTKFFYLFSVISQAPKHATN